MASYDPAVCEIVVWHGYVKAEFVASVSDGDEIWEAARSPGFRCRAGTQPREDDERAVAAFDRLLEVLADEGWEPVSGGRPWYAYRFRRGAAWAHELPTAPRPSLREASRAAGDPAP